MSDIKSKEISMVKVKEVVLNPINRNKHNKDQIDRLVKIIQYQGFRDPIVISNTTGFVVAGEGRILAARKLKMEFVPAIFQDFENTEQEVSFGISHNAIHNWSDLDLSGINSDLEHLGPDFDIDLLGIKNFTIDVADKDGMCDPDEIPEKVEPRTKPGDLYIMGRHRLLCGDATNISDVDKLMNREKADMVFTDPPYGIGIDGNKEKKSSNPKQYRKAHAIKGWDNERPSTEMFGYILSLNVPTAIFGGNYFADLLPASRAWLYWGKGQDGALDASDGELVWTNLEKPLRSVTVNRAAIGKSIHPTQKPVTVVEFCLDFLGGESSVLDLFGGSGSTVIACEKTNRKCFMMELDTHYCDAIVARWEAFSGQQAILL